MNLGTPQEMINEQRDDNQPHFDILEFINERIDSLDRAIVATPEKREHLESFSAANHGVNDFLLMQMSMNFGYKLAMEHIKETIINENNN